MEELCRSNIKEIDNTFGVLQDNQLTVVSGDIDALYYCDRCVIDAFKKGVEIVIFCLRKDKKEYYEEILSNLLFNGDISKVYKLGKDNPILYNQKIENLSKHITIFDGNFTGKDIWVKIDEIKYKNKQKLDFVFIDGLFNILIMQRDLADGVEEWLRHIKDCFGICVLAYKGKGKTKKYFDRDLFFINHKDEHGFDTNNITVIDKRNHNRKVNFKCNFRAEV